MSDRQMFPARVRAVLGPTNTGKTHLAITRMLAHASGIIGFPLRLLARENYDRMVAVKGERNVALITGEEKIVPPGAKWFACTVEAMPLDRQAEFVAVDEIQLCADADRGHIFTDRLLHARGMVETMFLGAETIRPLLQRLVPQAEIETRPRLSRLSHAGPAKLTRLPPRSAVVAFSATEVYAIAEAVRRRRGGCAVVMGRLSPRTRNAQVALYQNREVDFLVATDAIGMGLNMDVDHVAFAALQKFDGHQVRNLTAQEAAQIAGRAGRGMRDGSFGTTADCSPLPDEIAKQIENHEFEPLQQLAWRSSDLDFTSVEALLASLAAPPPMAGLAKGNDAVDHITLNALARESEMRDLAQGRARVRLLWEACQVPDFRKISDDSHTRLCGRIFGHLAKDGRLPDEWVAGSIAGLDNIEGDLDTLMSRLSNIRVWSYIAARTDWLADAATHQAEARKAEDNVSDALHERLLARFVDRRAAHLIRRLDEDDANLLSAVTRQGEVVVEGHVVGRVNGFHFEPDPDATKEEDKRLVLRAARRALREEMPRRLAALEMAKDEAFTLTPQHRVLWEGADVARLRPGPEPLKPHIDPIASEFLDNTQRERLRLRLSAWLETLVKRDLGPLEVVETKSAEDNTLRGPAYRLRESMGLVPGGTEREIPAELRTRLKTIGVKAGRYALYLPEVLKPRAMGLRAQFWALRHHLPTPALPNPGLVSVTLPEVPQPPPEDPRAPRPPESWPPGFAAAMGWLQAGHVLLRLDVVERVAGELGYLTRRAPAPVPEGLASRLGIRGDVLGMVLEAMGFRLLPAVPVEEGQFGPPAPARISVLRPERPQTRPQRPERSQTPRHQSEAQRWNPAVMFGPPVPRELRAPRADRGSPRDGGRHSGPPRKLHPRDESARAVAGPIQADVPPHGARGARPERPRFEHPRPSSGRSEGPQQQSRREERGPRPDRGRIDAPSRDRNPNGSPREYQSGPKADSPFAILAQLKLKHN